jgi:AcrR family transcriptional regulator
MRGRTTARLAALTEAAGEMLLEGGFDALSLDMLIAKAGGSRRNIYHHFGGKEGLFIEAVGRLCADQGAPLRALRVVEQAGKPEETLRLFGRKLLEIVLDPKTLALHRLMMTEGKRFPELAETLWRSGHGTAGELLTPWIEKQQAEGRLRGGPPDRIAARFVDLVTARAQLRALSGVARLRPEAAELATIVDEAVDAFLFGHGADNNSGKGRE